MEKYIPVVVIKELGEIDKILTALKNNGINCAEITFRTACAAEAIAYASKNQLTYINSGIVSSIYSNDLSDQEMLAVLSSMQVSSVK